MIYANIATIPERTKMLKQTLNSIIFQIDRLYVNTGLNNKGDCEKFKYVKYQDGYIFTFDDDLIYPPDYVKTMIEHIERFDRKVIVSLHGRTFNKFPITSYYRGKEHGFHWDTDQDFDIKVDSGGTGVMAWHSDTIKINYDEITLGNCADAWMAYFARRANVPIMNVRRKSGWLKYIGPDEDFQNPKTIYSKHYNNDKEITQVYNGCYNNNSI